jgi:hypothetical protein
MARHCLQLLTAVHPYSQGSLPGIDVFWLESLLEFRAGEGDTRGEQAAMSCILVNTDPSPLTFSKLTHVLSCLQGVRVVRQWFAGADASQKFSTALNERPGDFTNVVVLVEPGPLSATTRSTVLAVGDIDRDRIGLRVAVSADANASLLGVDHCVSATVEGAPDVASRLFVALSTMAAPFLGSCLDVEDILPSLGSGTAPASLFSAAWFQNRQLLVINQDDEQMVRESSAVAAFILTSRDTPGKDVLIALRALRSEHHPFVYQVAEDFLFDSAAGAGRAAVTLICAPPALS